MRGAPLRIEPHEKQVSQLFSDAAVARMKIKTLESDPEWTKRWLAGDKAEKDEMTILHRAETERQAAGLDWDGSGGGVGKSGAAKWTEAVTKLIPAEVVAAYLAAKSVIPTDKTSYWILTVFCFILVICSRSWMTSDKGWRLWEKKGVPVEGSAVFISAVSFLVWVYSLGDLFKMYGLWSAENSSHVLAAWTIACPVLLLAFKRK